MIAKPFFITGLAVLAFWIAAGCSPSSSNGPSSGDTDLDTEFGADLDTESSDGDADGESERSDTDTEREAEIEADGDGEQEIGAAAFQVDASGGTFSTEAGVELSIPAGALDAPVTILIDEVSGISTGAVTAVGAIWRFRPSGLRFLMPISVTLPFDIATAGEGPFTMYWTLPDDLTQFEKLPGTTVFDDRVSGSVQHFSMGFVGLIHAVDGDLDSEGEADATDGESETDAEDDTETEQPDGDVVIDGDWLPDGDSDPLPDGDQESSILCQACLKDEDCPTGECLTMPDGQFCSLGCAETSCPDPFVCRKLGSEPSSPMRCLPPSGSCTCYLPGDHGARRDCFMGNVYGVCRGQQLCDMELGWGGCTAATPAEEICDGVDNNCDGATDEIEPAQTCLTEGVCSGTQWICESADWVCPYPETYEEQPETSCDGLDNDCDGSTDEHLEGPLADNQRGVCKDARKVCGGPGGWVNYYLLIEDYEPTETLCDNLDNDCDGSTDEAPGCR